MNYRWLTHVLSGRSTNINALRLAPSCINISWSALQQHVLISDNSRVRKNYFLSKKTKQKRRLETAGDEITCGLYQFVVDQPSSLVLLWFIGHLVVQPNQKQWDPQNPPTKASTLTITNLMKNIKHFFYMHFYDQFRFYITKIYQ